MAKIRVYELARRLNLRNRVLVELLGQLDPQGAPASHMRRLDEETVVRVTAYLQRPADSAAGGDPAPVSVTDRAKVRAALARIRSTLDRRFEKDATLYLDSREVQQIKQALRDGNIAALVNWHTLGKYAAEALARVVAQHAWLLGDLPEKGLDGLMSIFEACRSETLPALATDIRHDRVDAPVALKRRIEALYYAHCPIEECRQALETPGIRPELAMAALRRQLRSLTHGAEVYRCLKQAFAGHETIRSLATKLPFDHLSDDARRELLERILADEILADAPQYPWETLFTHFGRPAFDAAWEHLVARRLNCRFRLKKKIIPGFFRSCAPDLDHYRQTLVGYYERTPWHRRELIEHCVGRIRDRSVRDDLQAELGRIGIPPETALNDDDERDLASPALLYEAIDEARWHPNPDAYLRYLIERLHHREDAVPLFGDLLQAYPDAQMVQRFAARYLEIKAKRPCPALDTALACCATNDDPFFREQLLEVIARNRLDSPPVRRFVEQNDFERFRTLYGR